MTKGKRKSFWRKQARAKERRSGTAPSFRDSMLGKVAQRGYGKGVAK